MSLKAKSTQSTNALDVDAGRRSCLRGAVVFATGAALSLTALRSLAASKASKQAMQYQDTPKNGQKCADCLQFEPKTKTCKVVAGSIDPNGYCLAFQAKD